MSKHVFLSYSSSDRAAAEEIARWLESESIPVYLAHRDADPGRSFQEELPNRIDNSSAVIVCVGPRGLGDWQTPEIERAVERQVHDREFRVIAILLPGVREDIVLPGFLPRNTWVRFIDSLRETPQLMRIRQALTGERPPRVAPTTGAPAPEGSASGPVSDNAAAQRTSEDAAALLVESLMAGNITFFVGSGAGLDEADCPPNSAELSRALLQKLNVLGPDESLLTPADVAGLYYAISRNDELLENEVVDLINARSGRVPPLHRTLADVLTALDDRFKNGRRAPRDRRKQLVVTTAYDLMLERAFLAAGLSFTRVVQHRAQPRLTLNEYHVKRDGSDILVLSDRGDLRERVRVDDFARLNALIETEGTRIVDFPVGERSNAPANPLNALALKDLRGVILYKYRGSQDAVNSCAISVDHQINFLCDTVLAKNVPREITEIVCERPILFLGYSVIDPEFRLVLHTLLREGPRRESIRRYLVHERPSEAKAARDHRVEAKIWDRLVVAGLQMGIETLQTSPLAFLRGLQQRASFAFM